MTRSGESTVLQKWLSPLVLAAVAGLVTVATYWSAGTYLVLSWWHQFDDYGHAFLVPVFSGYLLWKRREMVTPWPDRGTLWCLPFLVLWAAIRWGAAYFNYAIDHYSLIPFLVGVVLFLGGWRALHWAWSAILFLIFMFPLPGALAGGLGQELQAIGARTSVFVIQTLGIAAVSQGNIIIVQDTAVNVAEACSGLKMLVFFFTVCVGAAIVLDSPWWERVVIVLSAPPIAILANVARITVTALLLHLKLGELADKFFHDMSGLVVTMPVALIVLWAEISLLRRIFIETDTERPLSLP